MKNFFLALIISAFSLTVYADGETTKVCVDVKDKTGQVVKDAKGNAKQQCKEMKVHKKLEGTKLPEKK
jgi:hypothetical protein